MDDSTILKFLFSKGRACNQSNCIIIKLFFCFIFWFCSLFFFFSLPPLPHHYHNPIKVVVKSSRREKIWYTFGYTLLRYHDGFSTSCQMDGTRVYEYMWTRKPCACVYNLLLVRPLAKTFLLK